MTQDNLQLSSDFTAEEYSPRISSNFIDVTGLPPGGAVTTINGDTGGGAVGPVVVLSGGATGFSFTAVGSSITMTGSGSTSAEVILATVSLNLNTNTKQTLYTVPVGKSAIITTVVLRGPSVDLSGGATTQLAFGFDAGATDWANPAINPQVITAASQFIALNQFAVGGGGGGPSVIGTAGQVFGTVCNLAFGSAATVTVVVIGNLF